MSKKNILFCGYPDAFIYDKANLNSEKKKHIFWGDTLTKPNNEKGEFKRDGDFLEVDSRDETGWILEDNTQTEPLLDIIFLDVGQGDCCIIVTPEDEKIIIDTGAKKICLGI